MRLLARQSSVAAANHAMTFSQGGAGMARPLGARGRLAKQIEECWMQKMLMLPTYSQC
jgi:hypothetical protein